MAVLADMRVRRVRLRVRNVAWMENYHGREAGLVGTVVEAVELDTPTAVAYVDDRDGEASEYVEMIGGLTNPDSPVGVKIREELRQFAQRRFLEGDVVGVRT